MTARRVATDEGLFVGISAGGTVAAALEVAKTAREGDVIRFASPAGLREIEVVEIRYE